MKNTPLNLYKIRVIESTLTILVLIIQTITSTTNVVTLNFNFLPSHTTLLKKTKRKKRSHGALTPVQRIIVPISKHAAPPSIHFRRSQLRGGIPLPPPSNARRKSLSKETNPRNYVSLLCPLPLYTSTLEATFAPFPSRVIESSKFPRRGPGVIDFPPRGCVNRRTRRTRPSKEARGSHGFIA